MVYDWSHIPKTTFTQMGLDIARRDVESVRECSLPPSSFPPVRLNFDDTFLAATDHMKDFLERQKKIEFWEKEAEEAKRKGNVVSEGFARERVWKLKFPF